VGGGNQRTRHGVAIDDFVTGCCSLRLLAKLPVDMLRIDRSFVQSIADTPMSQREWSRDRAVGHFSTRACTVHNNSRIPQSRRLYSVDFHSRYLTLELCGVSWG
jgi:EAL domain